MSIVVKEPLAVGPPPENGLLDIESILPPTDLLEEDGIPLETAWHRWCMNLLIEVIEWLHRDRKDFYVGGNQFIYFNVQQARNLDYRGPDFFFVDGVPHEPMRKYWAVWLEGGRYPDVIIELSSPTTARIDHTTKKDIYEKTFRTYEYFIYDPFTQTLTGWRLSDGAYAVIQPDEHGRLECRKLGLLLGTWKGMSQGRDEVWLRFFDKNGQPVPTWAEAERRLRIEAEAAAREAERQRAEAARQRTEAPQQQAEAERQRADAERQRAEALAAEVERLKALLAAQQSATPPETQP